MLGDQDGGPEVGVEPGDRGEHVVGPLRVELRRRLVEHERGRRGGERARDRRPLPLAAGQRRGGAVAQVRDAERVEHLLDPAAHRRLGQREVLEHERDVGLDVVDDELRLGVLVDEPDDVGELARLVGTRAAAEGDDVATEAPAGRVRHEAVGGAQQRALARPRRADDEEHLAGRDLEVDVAQRRPGASG